MARMYLPRLTTVSTRDRKQVICFNSLQRQRE
jgi:hypothetical protein